MNIRIISVGKVKQSFVLEGEAEYLKRLKPYTKISTEELGLDGGDGSEQQLAKEALKVKGHLKGSERVYLLDESGEKLSSKGFASCLNADFNSGYSQFVFLIGGPFGWHPDMRKEAHAVLSLSALTFPHQLSRLILIEQLYRAFSIIKGAPYHK